MDSVVAGVAEELSVSDSHLSSRLWVCPEPSPAADTLGNRTVRGEEKDLTDGSWISSSCVFFRGAQNIFPI